MQEKVWLLKFFTQCLHRWSLAFCHYDDIVIRGDTEKQSFAVFYTKDNRITASDCVNRPAEHMMSRKLISEKILIDKNRLSDETIPIKEIAN